MFTVCLFNVALCPHLAPQVDIIDTRNIPQDQWLPSVSSTASWQHVSEGRKLLNVMNDVDDVNVKEVFREVWSDVVDVEMLLSDIIIITIMSVSTHVPC